MQAKCGSSNAPAHSPRSTSTAARSVGRSSSRSRWSGVPRQPPGSSCSSTSAAQASSRRSTQRRASCSCSIRAEHGGLRHLGVCYVPRELVIQLTQASRERLHLPRILHPPMARQTAVKGDLVSASIDILDPAKPKNVAILASNPAVSPVTGWPVGCWWGGLVHPYWELTEHGYEGDIYSLDGGALVADAWSDPPDESGFSADDILTLRFIPSPKHAR